MVASTGVQDAHLVRIGGTQRTLAGTAAPPRYFAESSAQRASSASSDVFGDAGLRGSARLSLRSISATQCFSSALVIRAGPVTLRCHRGFMLLATEDMPPVLLPAFPVLLGGLHVLERGPAEIQIGLDPRHGVTITGLPGRVVAALR